VKLALFFNTVSVKFPDDWPVLQHLPLTQLTRSKELPIPEAPSSHVVVRLTEANTAAALELTALAKPGPFTASTPDFGQYFGIFDPSGELIAMAGERLRVLGYVEISAVCTRPGHTGKGLARTIILHLLKRIHHELGEDALIHSRSTAERTINIYRSLGFVDTPNDMHCFVTETPNASGGRGVAPQGKYSI
jgi:ribosomal protein S18 acetylase RimI-like enzyme